MKKKPAGYVLYVYTQLQDGHEEFTKVFAGTDDVLKYLNNRGNWPGDSSEYRLFELGKEIPLESYEEREPQPDKVVVKYRLKKGKK